MSIHRSACKAARRVGTDLGGKSGIRDINTKCKLDRLPGMHWQRRVRSTDYSEQLKMKQAIRFYYRVSEKQFKRTYDKAAGRKGPTGENLMQMLESRLDNVVYRLGFGSTRAEARQLVSHGSVLLNGRRVTIASTQEKPDDVIEVNEKAKAQLRIKAALDLLEKRKECGWLSVDKKAMKGTFKFYPELSDLPPEFKVNLVVELYSK